MAERARRRRDPGAAAAVAGALFGLGAALGAPALASRLEAQVPAECYRIETIETPAGIAPEVGGLAFTSRGRLAVCFLRGTVWLLDPASGDWTLFASGLQVPLGILPGGDGEFFVVQMPELTRLADTDLDGRADLYETLCDRWGMSGNYHEFVSGPLRDPEGNFYVGLGCASSSGGVRPLVRGELRDLRPPGGRYGHFSPVPYRGWVVKISPAGELTPLACGFRQPNGLAWSVEGDILAADNQGDWVGTSPLHHVTPGAFHGHPASLVWERGFEGDPFRVPVAELAARRKLPAIQFPQDDMAGSTAQPLADTTGGKFGPYAGQLFVAEWTHARIHRVFLEKVGGEVQGACFPFIDGLGLRKGSHRLAFSPDGVLYVGQAARRWGGQGDGLQRITWTGRVPMDILAMRLLEDGFELEFTKPVEPATASTRAFALRHYHYLYHPQYGSPRAALATAAVKGVEVSGDGRRVRLEVEGLVAGRVWELRPQGVRARDASELVTRLAAYTLNRLR